MNRNIIQRSLSFLCVTLIIFIATPSYSGLFDSDKKATHLLILKKLFVFDYYDSTLKNFDYGKGVLFTCNDMHGLDYEDKNINNSLLIDISTDQYFQDEGLTSIEAEEYLATIKKHDKEINALIDGIRGFQYISGFLNTYDNGITLEECLDIKKEIEAFTSRYQAKE